MSAEVIDWSDTATPPGQWSVSPDRGYSSRNFWVVSRLNPVFMHSTEYLSTPNGRKRFYIESKAIAAADKLNAASNPKATT